MNNTDKYIRAGFLAAGLANIAGVLGASKGFTNPHIAPLDPDVMSNFGLAMIVLWGLAYMATAGHWQHARWLIAVFFIEKLIYSAHWLRWIMAHGETLGEIYATDFMTGVFYTIYGPNDVLFALFFGSALVRSMTRRA